MNPAMLWLAIVGIAVLIGVVFLVLGAVAGGYESIQDHEDREEEARLLTNRRMSQ